MAASSAPYTDRSKIMTIARGICPIVSDKALVTYMARRILRWLPPRLAPSSPVLVRLVCEFMPVLRTALVRCRPAVFRHWRNAGHVSSRYEGQAALALRGLSRKGTLLGAWSRAKRLGDRSSKPNRLAMGGSISRSWPCPPSPRALCIEGAARSAIPQVESGKSEPTQEEEEEEEEEEET